MIAICIHFALLLLLFLLIFLLFLRKPLQSQRRFEKVLLSILIVLFSLLGARHTPNLENLVLRRSRRFNIWDVAITSEAFPAKMRSWRFPLEAAIRCCACPYPVIVTVQMRSPYRPHLPLSRITKGVLSSVSL